MTKPKIVCVLGSAILAPLTVALLLLAGVIVVGFVQFELLQFGPVSFPLWVKIPLWGFNLWWLATVLKDTYGYFFRKCYK